MKAHTAHTVCSFERRRPFDHFVTALLALDISQCVLWPGSLSLASTSERVVHMWWTVQHLNLGIFQTHS